MKRIFEISYLFDEIDTNTLSIVSNILDSLKMNQNVLVNLFRIYDQWINFDKINEKNYEIIKDESRNDNTYVFFPLINSSIEVFSMLDKRCSEYPAEVNYIHFNEDGNEHFKFTVGKSSKEIILSGLSNFIAEIYEDIIILKFDIHFYENNKMEIDQNIFLWEKMLNKHKKKVRRF